MIKLLLHYYCILYFTSGFKVTKSQPSPADSITSPSLLPSRKSPTLKPTKAPTFHITPHPSMSSPSVNPSNSPTINPTTELTFLPTFEITSEPTPTSQLPPQNPPCLCMFASSCSQDSDCCPGLFCKINVGWTVCVEPAYNASLCVTSLYGYGCATNADCCNPNATCEKEVCKLFCGTSPTLFPSTYKPTKKPSRHPTLFPTVVPSTKRPSRSPSIFISEVPTTLMPTERPTEQPTFIPSDSPTDSPIPPKPSQYPSFGKPTCEPTLKPTTATPTYTVTIQTVPVIKFESFITFLNVSGGLSTDSNSFGATSRTDITNDVDIILHLPTDSTTYVEDYIVTSSGGGARRILSLGSENSSVNIVAHVLTSASMSIFPPTMSVDDALKSLRSRLVASVFDGQFFGTLMYIAAEPDSWAGSSVVNISVVNSDIVFPPSAAPTIVGYSAVLGASKLSTTMISLIVCVVVVTVLFGAVVTFKLVKFFSSRRKGRNDPRLAIGSAKTSDFAMLGPNFTEVRTENLTYEFDLTDLKDINPSAVDIK